MIYDETNVLLVRETLILVLKISAPVLIGGMLIGLLISLIQSVTSIQDQTLTFVPKIGVMVVVAAILLPWIFSRLSEYAIDMFTLTIG